MNMYREAEAFERWLETHHLPSTAQLLWYKFMVFNNRCMWREWFVVDNPRMMVMLGTRNEKTFISARDKLLEAGLLEYRKGKKGSPNKYHLISIHCKFYSGIDSENDSVSNSVSDSISYSHNRHKTKTETLTFSCDDGDDNAGTRENAVSGNVESFVESMFKKYIGRIPVDGERESCLALMQVHDRALVESAFSEACQRDQKNMAYVRGVLRKFRERGIRTEEDEVAFDLTRR